MRNRIALLGMLAVLLLLSSMASALEVGGLTPVPCPQRAWTTTDPSFEPLPGAKAFFGRYDGGLYQIEIPDNWNGELVLYAHGLRRDNILAVQTPELRAHWIENGYAWAASSYRCNGAVFGMGLLDTMALRDIVLSHTGGRKTAHTYLVGPSMGGRITILGMREFPDWFDGGLAMCPAGQEVNDLRVAIVAAAELITGVHPALETLDSDLDKMSAVLGVFPKLTDKGRQLASIQVQLSGGARPFAMEGLASRFLLNLSEGVRMDPQLIADAATNVGTRYAIDPGLGLTAEDLDVHVRRTAPNATLRARGGPYPELAPFDGQLKRPLLTIHGTGDLFVPLSLEQALRRAVVAAGTSNMLVQRLMRIPGHCMFSQAEQIAAFDALAAWVKDGKRPEGDDVMGDLRDAGRRFTNPLRPGDPGTLR